MKKLIYLSAVAVASFSLFAQEAADESAAQQSSQVKSERREESAVWPAFLAICQWPRSADVAGLRLTIPFSTSQENITGLDVGLWGRSLYFEGIQLNVLRNDVVDGAAGIQVGIYNSVGRGDLFGVQAGLWNEALSFRGVQAGLVNVVGEGRGVQVGIINRAETFYGYQVGLVNIIREGEWPFMPIINIGFESFGSPAF